MVGLLSLIPPLEALVLHRDPEMSGILHLTVSSFCSIAWLDKRMVIQLNKKALFALISMYLIATETSSNAFYSVPPLNTARMSRVDVYRNSATDETPKGPVNRTLYPPALPYRQGFAPCRIGNLIYVNPLPLDTDNYAE